MRIQAAQLKAIARILSAQSTKLLFADKKAYAVGDTITIVLNLGTSVLSSGTFAVDCQKFKEVTGRFDAEVDIELTANTLKLKHKRSRIELPIIKDPIIPKIAEMSGAGQLFNTKGLMEMLNFVQQASERKDMYSYAGVVSVLSRSGHLTAVATDGKRVAICAGGPCSEFIPVLLPATAISALKSLLGQSVSISEDQSNIYFQSGDVLMVARRLAQPFPNWESIIPTSFNLKISVKGPEMRECLKDVKPVIDPKTERLSLTVAENCVTLAVDGGLGKAETSCPATSIESDLFDLDHKLIVNHSFLADFFDECDGDVIIGVGGESSPLYLESNNKTLICLTQKP